MSTVKDLFLENSSLQNHIDAQNTKYSEYIANLFLLFNEYNIEFTILKLTKILVAAMLRKDTDLATYLLKEPRYDLPVILKCCEMLDSNRLHATLTKKIEKYPTSKKVKKYKPLLSNLKALNEGVEMRLTKSKTYFLKINWITHISKERLEYMALLYPIKQWKSLINLFHLKPTDFQLPWFTSYIFTGLSPQNSIVDVCNSITKDNIQVILTIYKLPYDFMRLKYKQLIDVKVLKQIFDYTSLANILRHWDDFYSELNIISIIKKLDVEPLDMPYGELVKRIQIFIEKANDLHTPLINCLMDIAENKLAKYQIDIEQPVVVLGDASASMDVAIKTSSIITSILVKICNAKLHLFRNKDEIIETPPTNVKEVLDMMVKFKAGNSTAPAASLYPYYERKEIVKTFILITDEEENTGHSSIYSYKPANDWFANTFKLYREEVYPAKLVFVSFLKNNKDGLMVSELKRLIPDIDKDITRFVMNNKNPDLRKLDGLLDKLAIQTDFYNEKCMAIVDKFNNIGNNIFDNSIIDSVLNGQIIISIDI